MALKTRNPRLSDLFETPQKSTYTVAGVTVVLTILMIFAVIRPSITRILTQISENQRRREVVDELTQKFSSLQTLIEKEKDLSEELVFFDDEIFPDSRREDEFIANISQGAEELGLKLVSIGVSEDTEVKKRDLPADTKTYFLTVSVVGDTAGIESFVQFIEGFPRTISITEISLGKVDSTEIQVSGNKNIRLDIKGLVYFYESSSSKN